MPPWITWPAALSLAEIGDRTSYENFRDEAIGRFKGTDIQAAAERIIKISLLQPADGKVLAALAPLAEVAARPFTNADEGPEIIAFREAWRAISLALLEYRSGRYAKAIEWCRSSLACRQDIPVRTATARLILAMSLRQERGTKPPSLSLSKRATSSRADSTPG